MGKNFEGYKEVEEMERTSGIFWVESIAAWAVRDSCVGAGVGIVSGSGSVFWLWSWVLVVDVLGKSGEGSGEGG